MFEHLDLEHCLIKIEKTLSLVDTNDPTLYTGKTGIALYYLQRYLSTSNDKYLSLAFNILGEIVEIIKYSKMPLNLNNLVGIFWFLSILKEKELIDVDDEFIRNVNLQILEQTVNFFDIGNIDFFFGATGNCLYLMDAERDNDLYRSKAINGYVKCAVNNRVGVTWLDKTESIRSVEYHSSDIINLGISHGMVSVLFTLKKIASSSSDNTESKSILIKATRWLLSVENAEDCVSSFPTWVTKEHSEENKYSRLGWCYGDLSIAYVLLEIGEFLKDDSIIDKAVQIVDKTLCRYTDEETSVKDHSICHGIFGVVYLYFKFFKKLKDDKYLQSVRYWIEKGILEMNAEDDLRLEKSSHTNVSNRYSEWGMLIGVAGTGLVINSLLDQVSEQIWDRFLMLS